MLPQSPHAGPARGKVTAEHRRTPRNDAQDATSEDWAGIGKSLERLARSMFGGSDLASEVAQRALVRLWRRSQALSHIGSEPTTSRYLWLILRSEAANLTRSGRIRREVARRSHAAGGYSDNSDGLRALEVAELRGILEASLARLTSPQRQAIVLHELLGWTLAAVASELRVDTSTVRTHLRRGMNSLRSDLHLLRCGWP